LKNGRKKIDVFIELRNFFVLFLNKKKHKDLFKLYFFLYINSS